MSQVTIGEQAFAGCRKLNRVLYIPDKEPTCPTNVFDMTKKLDNVTVSREYYRFSHKFCGETDRKSVV